MAKSRNDFFDQMHDLTSIGMVQKQTTITDATVNRYVNKKLDWLFNEV